MDRLSGLVVLKYEYARPLRELRVILHRHGCGQSLDCLAHKELVGREFLITMSRNTYLAPSDECSHLLENQTHCRDLRDPTIQSSSVYSFDPLTTQMSRAPRPQDRMDRSARRLHLMVMQQPTP